MDSLKNKWHSLPLRRFFILTVFFSTGIVVLLSALIISFCISFRHWLLPDSNAVYLTIEKTSPDGVISTQTYLLKYGKDLEQLPTLFYKGDGVLNYEDISKVRYNVQKIENTFDKLSPKRKFAYQICGVLMIIAPAILAFVGIILCGLYFYRKKLKKPLELLSCATIQIAKQNLDFELIYNCNDEMGALCDSFEKMRNALYENNKVMWEMLEERQLIQASVAHDLRNPIAIIEGYTEYLDSGLKNGTISYEKIGHIVNNLNMAAKRLEQYTESVRLLNQSEETPLHQKTVLAKELINNVTQDFMILAEQNNIILQVTQDLSDEKIQIDEAILYRILENIINNALRFAKKQISLHFTLSKHLLLVTIIDDGVGFPLEILKQKKKLIWTSEKNEHMGIGLAVSRLLCKKHGGSLELSNTTNGACVKINLTV